MNNNTLKHPKIIIDHYIQRFHIDDQANDHETAIIKLLKSYPHNNSIEDVLLKVNVINALYSTSVYSTYQLASHILELKIDKRLKNGDPSLVHDIASGHTVISSKTGKELFFYSFATKYCNWHNQDEFPIYDSFVDRLLMRYKRESKFLKFKQSDLRDYEKFKPIIFTFRDYFGLGKYSIKEIDKFLWYYGKKVFKK